MSVDPRELEARIAALREPRRYPVPITGRIGPVEQGWVGKTQAKVGDVLGGLGEKLDRYQGLVNAGLRVATGMTGAPHAAPASELSGLESAASGLRDASQRLPLVRMPSGINSLDVDPRLLDVAEWTAPGVAHLGRAAAKGTARAAREFVDAAGQTVSPLTTFHGTPHTLAPTPDNPLGEFDEAYALSGEGAAAYGHGVPYLAEAPETGRTYAYPKTNTDVSRDDLARYYAPGTVHQKGSSTDVVKSYDPQTGYVTVERTEGGGRPRTVTFGATSAEWRDVRRKLGQPLMTEPQLYTVDLPDEHIANMLDLARPLREQPVPVRTAWQQHWQERDPDVWSHQTTIDPTAPQGVRYGDLDPDVSGHMIYEELARSRGGQRAASEYLRSHGVPGAQYFDQQSRAAGRGTRNFVMYDPKAARITHREPAHGGPRISAAELRAQAQALRKQP
jgi:hypothetical protein